MRFAEFTNIHTGSRVRVNADKVLALYDQGPTGKPPTGTWLEMSASGCDNGDGAGPMVKEDMNIVEQRLRDAR